MNQKVDYYFHDHDMRHDPKINALRNKFPGWGYSAWNMLLEALCDSRDRRIPWDDLNQELLAADFLMDKNLLVSIVEYTIKLGLLQLVDGRLTSQRFQERLSNVDDRRNKRSEAGRKGATARWGDTPDRMAQNGTLCDCQADGCDCLSKQMQERRGEDRKGIYSSSFNSSSSSESAKEEFSEEQQQEEIVSIFFFKNFSEPNKEFTDVFVPYNNTADRCWDRMTPLQRISSAKLWVQKSQRSPRFAKDFLALWSAVYAKLLALGAPHQVMMAALADDLRFVDSKEKSKIRTGTVFYSSVLHEFLAAHMDDFRGLFREHGFSMRYVLTDG